MEIDINDILREVITFLECLRDAQLPLTLENLREKLLVRSKNILSVTRNASSPEPYLDMKSGPRSLLLRRSEADPAEEYVGMEESRTPARRESHQDYYESFENESQAVGASEQNDEGQTLIEIYKNLSAMQIKSKCYKCGPLYRKEGKKLFLSKPGLCWIALVGSHLLIYRSERHNRPYAIYPIRGYMARPAPNMIPRDRQKSESAFEMYNPGNETLQFIARSRKDMDQWIAKVCEVGCNGNESEGSKGREKRRAIIETPDCKGDDLLHRDAEKSAVIDKTTTEPAGDNKNEIGRKSIGRAPPLPARIPRRLPSLPPRNSLSSYRVEGDNKEEEEEEDDDDDIYHRIEDLRNETTRYQNVLSKKQQNEAGNTRQEELEETVAYDDVRELNERNEMCVEGQIQTGHTQEEGKSRDAISSQETYDDIVILSQIDGIEPERSRDTSIVGEKEETQFYDDVESLSPSRRFAKDYVKNEMSSKLQKKSFLDRVLSRRESPGKSNKRHCYKVPSNQTSTYDDVSDLTSNEEFLANGGEELPEYNCPPPPRPIYEVKSPAQEGSPSPAQTEESYDDVGVYQDRRNKNHQQIVSQASRLDASAEANQVVHNMTYNAESETNGDSTREEMEHYQSPRSDSCIPDVAEIERNEQLYDDIALWADFTARQRDIVGKSEDVKPSDKKAWNRFAVNRKSRVTSDFSCSAETNKRNGDEIEDSAENCGLVKRNTFQKLISRMENSLAKVSARSPSSFATGKPGASSNNS